MPVNYIHNDAFKAKYDVLENEKGQNQKNALLRSMLNDPFRYFKTNDEDIVMDGCEYFCRKFSALLRRHDPEKQSFPVYCLSTVRKYSMSLRQRRYDDSIKEQTGRYCHVSEFDPTLSDNGAYEVREPERCLPDSAIEGDARLRMRKKVYMLALKCAWHLRDGLTIRTIASFIGIEESSLSLQLETLREKIEERHPVFFRIQRRRDELYGRMCLYRQRRKGTSDGHSARDLEEKILVLRNRIGELNERLRGFRLNSSHADIALVLGIPKGTVDSTLYTLLHPEVRK